MAAADLNEAKDIVATLVGRTTQGREFRVGEVLTASVLEFILGWIERAERGECMVAPPPSTGAVVEAHRSYPGDGKPAIGEMLERDVPAFQDAARFLLNKPLKDDDSRQTEMVRALADAFRAGQKCERQKQQAPRTAATDVAQAEAICLAHCASLPYPMVSPLQDAIAAALAGARSEPEQIRVATPAMIDAAATVLLRRGLAFSHERAGVIAAAAADAALSVRE